MFALADLRMDYPLGNRTVPALEGHQPRGGGRRVLHPARAVRLRQDHDAAQHRRAGDADRRRHPRSTAGRLLGGQRRSTCPPNRRDIAMVFQSYAIWPHMTVGENVAFPLETMRASARRDAPSGCARALELVGLARPRRAAGAAALRRTAAARRARPRARQERPVAAARRAVVQPRRQAARADARRAARPAAARRHHDDLRHARPGRGAGDVGPHRLMRDGEVVEIGSPEDLYLRPSRRFTAEFLGRSDRAARERRKQAGAPTATAAIRDRRGGGDRRRGPRASRPQRDVPARAYPAAR